MDRTLTNTSLIFLIYATLLCIDAGATAWGKIKYWQSKNDIDGPPVANIDCLQSSKQCSVFDTVSDEDRLSQNPFFDALDNITDKKTHKRTRISMDSTLTPFSSIKGVLMHSSHKQPYTCVARIKVIDNGQFHYPRYISSAVCSSQVCLHCRYKQYKIHVLKLRDETDDINDPYIPMLPEKLQKDWAFKPIWVNTGCECVV